MADLRGVSFCSFPAQAFLGAFDDEGEEVVGLGGVGGEVVVEAVAQGGLHQAGGFRAGELFLCLALELRIPEEHRQLGGELAGDVIRGDGQSALVGALLAPAAQ